MTEDDEQSAEDLAVTEDEQPPPEWERRRGGKLVWAVHVTLVNEVRPTDAVFGTEEASDCRGIYAGGRK